MEKLKKTSIFGTFFSKVDLDAAIDYIKNLEFNRIGPQYACFPSTDTIVTAYRDKTFQKILNNSLITFVDGKFTEFYARSKGHSDLKNVSGYWLMENLLQTELTHFFYGCDDDTLARLENKLSIRFPDAKILGFKSPPYVQRHDIYPNKQIISDFKEINKLGPDIIWIGISTPKQDYLMYYYHKYLDKGIMFGVGAVFLYHAGVVDKGPEFLKKLALRWVYRLAQEPRRLFKRMIPGIAGFLVLVIKHDILRQKIE